MKYLRRLKTESDYAQFMNSDNYVEPHVVTVEESSSNHVKYKKIIAKLTLQINGRPFFDYDLVISFEEGMTWEEWCNSTYNTYNGYVYTNDYGSYIRLTHNSGTCTITNNNSSYLYVRPNDIMSPNNDYSLEP